MRVRSWYQSAQHKPACCSRVLTRQHMLIAMQRLSTHKTREKSELCFLFSPSRRSKEEKFLTFLFSYFVWTVLIAYILFIPGYWFLVRTDRVRACAKVATGLRSACADIVRSGQWCKRCNARINRHRAFLTPLHALHHIWRET